MEKQPDIFTFKNALESLTPAQIYELIKEAQSRILELTNIIEEAKDAIYDRGMQYEDMVLRELYE